MRDKFLWRHEQREMLRKVKELSKTYDVPPEAELEKEMAGWKEFAKQLQKKIERGGD